MVEVLDLVLLDRLDRPTILHGIYKQSPCHYLHDWSTSMPVITPMVGAPMCSCVWYIILTTCSFPAIIYVRFVVSWFPTSVTCFHLSYNPDGDQQNTPPCLEILLAPIHKYFPPESTSYQLLELAIQTQKPIWGFHMPKLHTFSTVISMAVPTIVIPRCSVVFCHLLIQDTSLGIV